MNNDLISRAAAIEILMKYCPDDDGTCSKADADPREMLDEIENISAVDAEPVRHGRWIHDNNNLYGCSECLSRETMSHRKLKNYCPDCGAKMEVK